MTFDLIVKGGTLPDGTVRDIAIRDGLIAAIEPFYRGRGWRGD